MRRGQSAPRNDAAGRPRGDEVPGPARRHAKRAGGPRSRRYVLRLYVTGMTPRSTAAFATIKAVCEQYLRGLYDLQVIDVYQHPALARDEQIVAVPTLVKKLPAPLRRLIGDLSDTERVLLGLDLRSAS